MVRALRQVSGGRGQRRAEPGLTCPAGGEGTEGSGPSACGSGAQPRVERDGAERCSGGGRLRGAAREGGSEGRGRRSGRGRRRGRGASRPPVEGQPLAGPSPVRCGRRALASCARRLPPAPPRPWRRRQGAGQTKEADKGGRSPAAAWAPGETRPLLPVRKSHLSAAPGCVGRVGHRAAVALLEQPGRGAGDKGQRRGVAGGPLSAPPPNNRSRLRAQLQQRLTGQERAGSPKGLFRLGCQMGRKKCPRRGRRDRQPARPL